MTRREEFADVGVGAGVLEHVQRAVDPVVVGLGRVGKAQEFVQIDTVGGHSFAVVHQGGEATGLSKARDGDVRRREREVDRAGAVGEALEINQRGLGLGSSEDQAGGETALKVGVFHGHGSLQAIGFEWC